MFLPKFKTIIDTAPFTIHYSDDSPFAEFIIKDGILYDEALARETRAILTDVAPDKKYYLLVHCEGFFRVTRKTRKLGASKSFSEHLSAVAFYTDNFSLALLGELYNKINKPAVPTKVFYVRAEAEAWLIKQQLLAQSDLSLSRAVP